MREYDVPLDDVIEAFGGGKVSTRKGSKAKAKYRDPATGTEWSGRGKPPAWIKGVQDRTPFEIRE
jgi:DNA-binding protein H-NS